MRVIGMISGTSFDAVEAVLADFSPRGATLDCGLVAHRSVEYPDDLRERIAGVLPPAATHIGEVCELDVAIGQFFGEVAHDLADEIGGQPVDLVCSHGQTVFHWVSGARALGTLQLGQPAWIAARTGATVVSDVRSRDIAEGGHGAPLASVLDVLLLGPPAGTVRGALNLGGISNVTVLAYGREPVAFDIGPANALMDAVVSSFTSGRERFDAEGSRAARGLVDEPLLSSLLDEPYYLLEAPKSTGKELFNLDYVLAALAGREVETDDLVATLGALTVETVARALTNRNVTEVVAAGGGTRNPILMSQLRRRLAGVKFRPLEDFGVPEASKEALAFALIGYLTGCGIPASVPSCTGARRSSILGSLTPGERPLPEDVGVKAPSHLEVHPAGPIETTP
ncbi:MAG: anhydro-N-acetylmuramic acid kinase [Acidimicrobiales bacterium]|jgi:anhydro-N-acetylmuramic acid kinase